MRVVVVGLGVQGRKRLAVAGSDVIATVDPISQEAHYRAIQEVPLDLYDAALLCIPDEPKIELMTYLLLHKKHILVEKPLFAADMVQLTKLKELAEANKTTCYTAYNHRFEPHFVRMKQLIDSGSLGRIYSARMFYGNGTARLVRESVWRDQGAGVLPDLGSHLLDTALFWFGISDADFSVHSANCFENRAADHVVFGAKTTPNIQMEVTLLSWRNHFYADIFAEKASVHISSLCKWGPSKLYVRERQLPSGRPNENIMTLVQPDPTWALEYDHFKKLCRTGETNLNHDIWINRVLTKLCNDVTHIQKESTTPS
jgi:scyllo-inositol 2-dehydrogenase (NADP+)